MCYACACGYVLCVCGGCRACVCVSARAVLYIRNYVSYTPRKRFVHINC